MLEVKKDRKELNDLLDTYPNYELERVLLTTYSIDLNALLSLCVLLGMSLEYDEEDNLKSFLALEKMKTKMIVFSQTGKVIVPPKKRNIFVFLEPIIHMITTNKTFHPKICLAKYKSKNKNKESDKYKLIVSSKNLTFDNSWNTEITIEGNFSTHKQDTPTNTNLSHFLNYLKENTTQDNRILNNFIKEVSNIKFDLDTLKEGNKNLNITSEFIYFPSEKFKIEQLVLNEPTKTLLISPFVEKHALEKILNKVSAPILLLTRKTELAKIKELQNKNLKVFVKNDFFDAIEDKTNKILDNDIHLKFYLSESKQKTLLCTGSPNLTYRAFNGNTEAMIKIEINEAKLFNNLAKNLRIENEYQKENDTEIPYFKEVKLSEVKIEEVNEIEELLKNIEEIFFTKIEITAHINIEKKNSSQTIELTIKNTHFLKEEIEKAKYEKIDIEISPLLQTNYKSAKNKNRIKFENINVENLSEFFLIKFIYENKTIEKATKIQIDNIDELPERLEIIKQSISLSKDNFYKYLSYILTDNYSISILENITTQKNNLNRYSKINIPYFYESLLKAISENINKNEELQNLLNLSQNIKELTEEDKKEIEELKEICSYASEVLNKK